MTIELLTPYFGWTSEMWRLSSKFRREIFEAISNQGSYGFIFTYVWAFDSPDDWEYVEKTCKIFSDKGGEVYWVELQANVEERLERNKSSHRLQHKPTKRNIETSERNLKQSLEEHRLNSHPGEITTANYMKIDNTHLSAAEVAQMIKEKFKF
jgi:hypothetical protein